MKVKQIIVINVCLTGSELVQCHMLTFILYNYPALATVFIENRSNIIFYQCIGIKLIFL